MDFMNNEELVRRLADLRNDNNFIVLRTAAHNSAQDVEQAFVRAQENNIHKNKENIPKP